MLINHTCFTIELQNYFKGWKDNLPAMKDLTKVVKVGKANLVDFI